MVEVGNLGVNAQAAAGFDITTFDIGFAALRVNGRSGLYFINLVSGKASLLGNFPTGINIIGLAISTEPVAYAVDGTNNLLIFNPFNIQPVSKAITGLQSGENILGIDMRPANGQLYALGSTSRLYTINASSGVAVVVGTAPLAPVLNGTQFGFDFNPTVDRIRIVSNTGQNLRAHPETGAIAAVDGALNPGTPAVTAAAYTNNFAGATTTSLFVIDATNKKLYLQNPPNNGTLTSVGDLPNTFSQSNGFDIGGTTGKAYGLFQDDNLTRLYEINLQTGQLNRGIVVPATSVRGFAIGLGF